MDVPFFSSKHFPYPQIVAGVITDANRPPVVGLSLVQLCLEQATPLKNNQKAIRDENPRGRRVWVGVPPDGTPLKAFLSFQDSASSKENQQTETTPRI